MAREGVFRYEEWKGRVEEKRWTGVDGRSVGGIVGEDDVRFVECGELERMWGSERACSGGVEKGIVIGWEEGEVFVKGRVRERRCNVGDGVEDGDRGCWDEFLKGYCGVRVTGEGEIMEIMEKLIMEES
ncbi:hypothetical protein Tco_0580838 [Tanacetum coccineum]